MDSAMDEPELEEETEEEVDKVGMALLGVPSPIRCIDSDLTSLHMAGDVRTLSSNDLQSAGDHPFSERTRDEADGVEQVLMEIAGESLEQLANSAAPRQKIQPAAAVEAEADEDEALQARLDAVRS